MFNSPRTPCSIKLHDLQKPFEVKISIQNRKRNIFSRTTQNNLKDKRVLSKRKILEILETEFPFVKKAYFHIF